MESVPFKVCARCKESKRASDFGKNRRLKDGLNCYCKPCVSVINKEWRENNREKFNAIHRRYRAENKGALNQYQRERYEANKEFKRTQNKAYRAKDPEAARQKEREYYDKTKERRREQAREKYHRNKQDAEWRNREWARLNNSLHEKRNGNRRASAECEDYIVALRGDPCSYCNGKLAGQIDHIVALAKGGVHEPDNLTAACRSCNASKRDKDLLGFLLCRRE